MLVTNFLMPEFRGSQSLCGGPATAITVQSIVSDNNGNYGYRVGRTGTRADPKSVVCADKQARCR